MVHGQQQLTPAADRKRLDRGDPRLLVVRFDLLRPELRTAQAAIHLVQKAHVADHEEVDQRDLAVVQVGEIDAGVEDAPPGVLGVLDHLAAHHADVDARIEQKQVGTDLERAGGRVILGVQIARVAVVQVADRALAFNAGRADVETTHALELVECVKRFAPRAQHRVHEMAA